MEDKIKIFWLEFIEANPEYVAHPQPINYYFCDNEVDANECAELVVQNIKQATTASVWWYNKMGENMPQVGDLAIVTDWHGNPKALIRNEKVEIVKFADITEEYATIEGEGDKTLAYWKRVHWDYYSREMQAYNETPTEDMELVCEIFQTIG